MLAGKPGAGKPAEAAGKTKFNGFGLADVLLRSLVRLFPAGDGASLPF